MSALLTRARRRGAALAAALAVGTLGLIGGSATPAAAAIPIYTVPCWSGSNICLYETEYNQGFTAFALYDVAPTPYYYSIWNLTNGAQLALCGGGMECSTGQRGYPGPGQCFQYIAYVGGPGGTLPPPPVIRTSQVLRLCR